MKQEISMDIELEYDMTQAVKTDTLFVDYAEIANVCAELARNKEYRLLETLAHDALSALMHYPSVSWACIRVRKPGAVPGARYAMVEMQRGKKRCGHL